jgi:hypothetical protein
MPNRAFESPTEELGAAERPGPKKVLDKEDSHRSSNVISSPKGFESMSEGGITLECRNVDRM